jgi:hypothetical protein
MCLLSLVVIRISDQHVSEICFTRDVQHELIMDLSLVIYRISMQSVPTHDAKIQTYVGITR